MPDEQGDWRLAGQEAYLLGAVLGWKNWAPPADNPAWDHDHCEFCWQKFMTDDGPDVHRAGYTTEDQYHWICRRCFEDFRQKFKWKLKGASAGV